MITVLDVIGRAMFGAGLGIAAVMVWQWNADRRVVRMARLKRVLAQLQAADGRAILARLDDEMAAEHRRLCEELALLPESEDHND